METTATSPPVLPRSPSGSSPAGIDLAKTIVIVSGLPRSGTSLMMQMLSAGRLPVLADETRHADADNPRGYFEYQAAKRLRRDSSWLPDARGKAVKIIAQLLGFLPGDQDYRIVFMKRNLAEVVASQRKMLERQGKDGARLSDEALERVYGEQVQRVQRLLTVREIETLPIAFADCIGNPPGVAARVNAFLGGSLDETAMAACVDPTLYHQRRPTA
jgi:hypothetical protein